MKAEKEGPSDQQQHDAAIELLKELGRKLHSKDISTARVAGFKLSWMQEICTGGGSQKKCQAITF